MERSRFGMFMARVLAFVVRLGGAKRDAFLCDSCKYDYGNACRRPERPNARVCPDYKRGR